MTVKSKSNYKTKSRLSEIVRSTSVWLGTSLVAIITVTSFLFLNNVTIKSQHGFRFKQQELLKNELTETNQDLKIKILNASSSDKINSSRQVKRMVQANEVEFFNQIEPTITQNPSN